MIYRAFYAIPGHLHTASGLHTNAIFGFATMFQKLFAGRRPDFGAVVFDAPGKTFRDEAYAEYKADRGPMDDKLRAQLPWIDRLVKAFRFETLKVVGYEADDVIGTLSDRAVADGMEVLIVSADKDFCQLISADVKMFDAMRDVTYDVELVRKKWGVVPEHFVDLLALTGDKIDNIPGVPGIGKKGAADLIAAHGGLESILENVESLKGRAKKALEEHRDDAILSKKLATIDREVPLDVAIDSLTIPEIPQAELNELYRELEFYSLLEGAELPEAERSVPVEIGDASVLDGVTEPVAIVPIYEKPSPIFGRWVGAALAFGERCIFVPLDGDPAPLAKWLASDQPKIVHDAKALWVLCRRFDIALSGVAFDTMLASYLVDPAKDIPHRLEQITKTYLHRTLTPVKKLIGSGQKEIGFGEIEPSVLAGYAGELATAVFEVWPKVAERLEEEGHTSKLAETELPFAWVLGRLELDGVAVDKAELEKIGTELAARLEKLEARVFEIAGDSFNIGSTKQLAHVLFEKLELPVIKRTKTGYSTASDVLERLAPKHEIARAVLEHRQVAKLINTYTNVLTAAVDDETGRIHGTYQQTVSTTGRIISTDPDLQRTPVKTEDGVRIRRAFVAPPGQTIVSADWSQIELRILAHVSGDKKLIDAFETKADIHRRTASQLFDCKPEDVTPQQRGVGKTVNFATIYGQGANALGQILGVPKKDAEGYIERYFETYHGVREWLDKTIERAKEDGYVETLFGRRRYIPELFSHSPMDRQTGYRMAANTPIQGSAADILKKAMLDVSKAFAEEKLTSKIVLQVHDELVVEAPQAEVEVVRSLLREKMRNAVELAVPLVVDVGVGPTWADAH